MIDRFIGGDDRSRLCAVAIEVTFHRLQRDVEDAVTLGDDVIAQIRESFIEVLQGAASIPLARMLLPAGVRGDLP